MDSIISIDYNICRYKQSSIAIASILLTLHFKEKFWEEFSYDWYCFLSKTFQNLIDQVFPT